MLKTLVKMKDKVRKATFASRHLRLASFGTELSWNIFEWPGFVELCYNIFEWPGLVDLSITCHDFLSVKNFFAIKDIL